MPISCINTEIQCKLFECFVRNCLKTSCDLSSEDETTYYDLNTKHMILKELRSRATRANSRSNEQFYSLYRTSNSDNTSQQKENIEDDRDLDNETGSFFSAKSHFSSCSSQGAITAQRSMLEEFKHLEGWPFGLWRHRPVVMLPPLPPTPANSWMWLRRNSEP